ncbi:hypothetical protein NQ315_007956 [Exocentrus adspersus]|uniref:THAP-type domain-containing protein n=1 Tax=Exocentrus adspersus TaxID=1586481 RepID=A0AAV8V7Q6_9CUCU|nr:hypothetical protein NQ315_007956 [Exocentrus adspersus]
MSLNRDLIKQHMLSIFDNIFRPALSQLSPETLTVLIHGLQAIPPNYDRTQGRQEIVLFTENITNYAQTAAVVEPEREQPRNIPLVVDEMAPTNRSCAVLHCKRPNREGSLFKMPNPAKNWCLFLLWLRAIGNPKYVDMDPNEIQKKIYICEDHFTDEERVALRRKSKSCIPSRNLPGEAIPTYTSWQLSACLVFCPSIQCVRICLLTAKKGMETFFSDPIEPHFGIEAKSTSASSVTLKQAIQPPESCPNPFT